MWRDKNCSQNSREFGQVHLAVDVDLGSKVGQGSAARLLDGRHGHPAAIRPEHVGTKDFAKLTLAQNLRGNGGMCMGMNAWTLRV